MELTVALFVLILFIGTIHDLRPLIADHSAKVWAIYSGLTALGLTLLVLSFLNTGRLNIFAPVEQMLGPAGRWVFRAP